MKNLLCIENTGFFASLRYHRMTPFGEFYKNGTFSAVSDGSLFDNYFEIVEFEKNFIVKRTVPCSPVCLFIFSLMLRISKNRNEKNILSQEKNTKLYHQIIRCFFIFKIIFKLYIDMWAYILYIYIIYSIYGSTEVENANNYSK